MTGISNAWAFVRFCSVVEPELCRVKSRLPSRLPEKKIFDAASQVSGGHTKSSDDNQFIQVRIAVRCVNNQLATSGLTGGIGVGLGHV
jgi:hypothetical protein